MALLGRINQLIILRESDHGFYLDGGPLGEILLPTREVPADVEQGDEVTVFVSRDSEDRIVATTQLPLCQAGEFAGLRVIEVNDRIGAFLDWGLPKDLLLPFAEQSKKVGTGQKVVVRVIIDETTNRIIATTKLGRYLDKVSPRYEAGQPVSLMVLEKTPLGYAAMIDRKHRGLIHSSEVHRELEPGEELQGYVRALREDYKIDLSLEPVGYGRVTDLSDRILETLRARGGNIAIGDQSSPELIRETFGTSKKAFKQAAGRLYKKKLIEVGPDHIKLVRTGKA
ncbi:MAG: S1-like domain-containing RNA-binding protein [Verrucomicrobiales bacterium]